MLDSAEISETNKNNNQFSEAQTKISCFASLFLLLALVFIPIFKLDDPHLWIYITISATLAYFVSRVRRKSASTAFRVWLVIPVSSTLLAYAAGGGKDTVHTGLVTVALLWAGLSLGSTSTDKDKQWFLRGFSVVAVVCALIGVSEYSAGAPFYAFSSLQQWSPFRASGMLVHPLILATVASAAVSIALIMPRSRKFPLWLFVGAPVLGAVASVSRSLIYLIAGAVVASVFARSNKKTSRRKVVLLASLLGTFLITQNALSANLGQRFTTLSSADQATRLNAPHVAEIIVTGYKHVIGGGPGYVAFALHNSPTLLRENHGYNTLDNGFLGVYANFGALGLISFMLAVLVLVRALRSRDALPGQRFAAVFGLIFVLANISFEALNWNIILFLFAWSLGAAANRSVPKFSEEPRKSIDTVHVGSRHSF